MVIGIIKYNRYDLNLEDEHGLYGIGYCSNTGHEIYFDMDDYDKIKDFCWYEENDRGYHRVRAYDRETKKSVFMHYIVADKHYDHIDKNAFNNRKYNLRKASVSENNRNRSLRKDNVSGVIGVTFKDRYKKWLARIKVNNNDVHLGYFLNKEDSIKARLEAEAKYFGDFAPQRHLFEEYGIRI